MKSLLSIMLLLFAVDYAGAQTLKEAIKTDTALAAKMIGEGTNPNEPDAYGTTLLMGFCHYPDLEGARFLLRHGATVDTPRSVKGRTALMVACAYWCGLDMVKLLVENGADVNAIANDGTTPLMLAAMNEKLDVVIYLLKQGADAGKKNSEGKSALDFATGGKVEEYMVNSIKDTRFDKDLVIKELENAGE